MLRREKKTFISFLIKVFFYNHHLIYIPNYSIVYNSYCNLVYSPYCGLVNSAMGWLKCQLFRRWPQTLCGFKDGTTIGYSIHFHYPCPLFSFPFPYGSSPYTSNCGTTYRKKENNYKKPSFPSIRPRASSKL